MPGPNAIDITTLAAVKAWLQQTGTDADQTIQDCITAFSLYALRQTGRGPIDGSVPTASPFNSSVAYNEWYDGSGTVRQFLRNWPITAVTLVTAGPITVPASTAWNVPGYVIDGDAKSISIRGVSGSSAGGILTVGFWNLRSSFGGPYGNAGYTGWRSFVNGVQNVNVQYTAGFPGGVPFDLEMLARKVVALNYKRSGWIGQRTRAMAQGAGTISFSTWKMDDLDTDTLNFYKRRPVT